MHYDRQLRLGSTGHQCAAVKHALARAGYGDLYAKSTKWPVFGKYAVSHLKQFQLDHDIPASGVFGPLSFKALLPYFDDWSASLYAEPDDKALATARAMVEFGKKFDNTYVWGGEHDSTVDDDSPHDGFDCSSSTSFLLWKFGLFDLGKYDPAQVSSWFENWGLPGKGKYVTVWSNSDHVWIEFDLPEGYARFDTSPHGDGQRGPRIRHSSRFTNGFVARHPKGL